jgi:hypothetical protein
MSRTRVIDGVEFVEQHYEIDPKTEQRLASGLQLRDGMMVVIDSASRRANLDLILGDSSEYSVAMWTNRWAKISNVEFQHNYVFFNATYADGSYTAKRFHTKYSWIVKKDSAISTWSNTMMPPYSTIQDWYGIAQQALSKAFDNWTDGPEDVVHMSSRSAAELCAKTALDATLPHIMEEMKRTQPMTKPIDIVPNIIYVPKYYVMDPETDDVIPTGEELKVGMVVLTELSAKRIDISRAVGSMSASEIEQLNVFNRWGKVVSHPVFDKSNTVYFVLEYDDGTKHQIQMNKYQAWYVKKDSLPDSE